MQALLDAIVNDPTKNQYEPVVKKKKIETIPSFVKETGIEIEKPLSSQANKEDEGSEQNDEKEEVEEEDELERIIKDTVDHVVQHDKQELATLLMELRGEVGEEFLDNVHDLVLLVDQFLVNELNDDA